MAYKGLGAFLVRVTLKAIAKLDEADVTECMRIAENVYAWYNAGTIDDEQLETLINALPLEIEMPDDEQASEQESTESESE